MRLLLDTHTLLWFALNDPHLNRDERRNYFLIHGLPKSRRPVTPKGIEDDGGIAWRKGFLRQIGYKL